VENSQQVFGAVAGDGVMKLGRLES